MKNLFRKVAAPAILFIYLFTVLLNGVSLAYADIVTEKTYYFLNDHLGNADVITDDKGNVVERADYLPYGEDRLRIEENGVPETDYKFTGKEKDDETGLYYYGARYYDSGTGRFTSYDPLLLNIDGMTQDERNEFLSNPQNFNGYAYALNNPVKYVDENGEFAVVPVIAFAISVIGAFIGSYQNVAAPDVNSAPAPVRDEGEIIASMAAGELIGGILGYGIGKAVSMISQLGFKTIAQLKQYRKLVADGIDVETSVQKTVKSKPTISKLAPDINATGDHTVIKYSSDGTISRYETYTTNPQNPTGFDKVKSVDLSGKSHYNKITQEQIPVPHTQAKNIPGGVRKSTADELPKSYN
jgi:RHS repeat-associated protein